MSLLNKLKRHKEQITREVIEQPTQIVDEFIDVWLENDVRIFEFDDQYCFVKETRYPLEYQHGKYTLGDIFQAVSLWQNFEGGHPLSSKGITARQLCFFDIETTGLNDGAGNTIFLIGYAYIEKDEVVVCQHVLPEPGNEVALYQSFINRLDDTFLVTYNGKSFDWPRIKTQHTLVRDLVPKLPKVGHFDLYHASRRLWKDQLESVKLVHVEEQILEIKRLNDLPGYLAPMIYFDYVERKNPEGVFEILKHNERDILSLLVLYTHLTMQIHGKDPNQTESERLQIAKWFRYIGEHELAMQSFKIGAGEDFELAQFDLAFYYKKNKQYTEAKQLWEKTSTSDDQHIKKISLIELAKLYEHQFKLLELALSQTEEAISIHGNFGDDDRFFKECNKRKQRLEIKLGKI